MIRGADREEVIHGIISSRWRGWHSGRVGDRGNLPGHLRLGPVQVQVTFGEVQDHLTRGLLGGFPVRDGDGEPDELAHDLSGRGRQHWDIAGADYLGERLPAPQQDPDLGRGFAWKAQSEVL